MTLASFLVDTDWVIDHFNGVEAVTRRLQALRAQGLALSVISVAVNPSWELTVGSSSKEKPGHCCYVARGCKSSGWIGVSPVKRLKSCGFKVSR